MVSEEIAFQVITMIRQELEKKWTIFDQENPEDDTVYSPVGKASATLSKFIETMNFWSIFKPARYPNWVQEKTKIDFLLLIFIRGIKHLKLR